MAKKRAGFFSFTCCEGCAIVFLEALNKKYDEWMKKMEIVNMRVLKKSDVMKEMDVAFVEGAISTESEVRKLKEIRKKSGKIVALGSGAVNGFPSNQRNKFNKVKKAEIKELVEKLGQREKILPIKNFVKVDVEIDGCPVDRDVLIEKVEEVLNA